jgi:hypothetical protein
VSATLHRALTELARRLDIRDSAGRLVDFQRIHRFRHTRATTLQMGGIASPASFGGSGERALPAVQHAALGRARSNDSPRTMRDLGCHHPLASGRTMMQPVRLHRIPA